MQLVHRGMDETYTGTITKTKRIVSKYLHDDNKFCFIFETSVSKAKFMAQKTFCQLGVIRNSSASWDP